MSASDTSDATIAALAERAVAMAREAPEDPTVGLADPGQIARSWDLAALDLIDHTPEPSAAALEAMAREAEAGALAVEGITQVEADASWSARQMHLALSNGFSGGYARIVAVGVCRGLHPKRRGDGAGLVGRIAHLPGRPARAGVHRAAGGRPGPPAAGRGEAADGGLSGGV